MRFTVAAFAAALVAGASAGSYQNATTLYTTEVVTAYTTFCPAPTSVVHGNMTYTVTEATTLTITNCPCTLTKPVITSAIVSCTSCSSTPAAVLTSSPSAAPTYANSTVVVVASTVPASSVVAPIATSAPSITPAPNAANKALAASSACLAGLFAFAVYFL